ncbi:MAG: hypothetical protein HUJ26_23140 [Planctomycetaceae bacterium]|nr:hypothetical protein [Planctomycetaceae bacterium]
MNYSNILQQIQADERYHRNLKWGSPRQGHPEGTIRAHIEELEQNLETLRPLLRDGEEEQLRLLIHVHDTFKPDAQRGVSITHPKSHSSLARAFLAEYCPQSDLLNIVQYHDEPYALWRQHYFQGQANEERYHQLLNTIESWDLFHVFLIIDGCTNGKSRLPLEWWFAKTASAVESRFSAKHLIAVQAETNSL